MNPHSPRPESVDLSSRGPLCVCLDASASGWTVLEAHDHDDVMLTRFVPNPLGGWGAAQIALKKANLRGPQRAAVVVGVHAHSLVLSMRVARSAATPSAVDSAREELLRFAAACGCP